MTALRFVSVSAVACVALVTASGCGRDPALDGSLTELVDLSYRKVEVVKTVDELALRFVMPQGAGEDVVLRVSASLVGTRVDAREPLDLTEEDALGQVRGKVARSVQGDALTQFPPLQRGQLTFEKELQEGALVEGELNLTFENGTHAASGRTVFGRFEARVR